MSSVVDPSADTASLTRQERRSRTAEALTAAGDAGDPRERLDLLEYAVRINMGVARSIAGRYHHRGIEEDDLVQVA